MLQHRSNVAPLVIIYRCKNDSFTSVKWRQEHPTTPPLRPDISTLRSHPMNAKTPDRSDTGTPTGKPTARSDRAGRGAQARTERGTRKGGEAGSGGLRSVEMSGRSGGVVGWNCRHSGNYYPRKIGVLKIGIDSHLSLPLPFCSVAFVTLERRRLDTLYIPSYTHSLSYTLPLPRYTEYTLDADTLT